MTYTLHTDGGSRQNPGPAAIGGLIHNESGDVITTFSEYIGIKTNNFAEYTALIKGLDIAILKGITNMVCYLDSELVVKQVNGIYKVKDLTLKKLHNTVKEKSKKFENIKFIHVKRTFNKEADSLVNKALNEQLQK